MGNTEENRLMPEAWQDGPRYGSPSTFMQIPGSRDLSKADVAVVGLPLDLGTIIRSGARFGPRGYVLRPCTSGSTGWRQQS